MVQDSPDEEEDDDQETQFSAPPKLFFPEHEKFKQKLIKSQNLANEKKKRIQICWRGYRTVLKPGQQNLENEESTLNDMLMVALKNVKKLTSDEEKV